MMEGLLGGVLIFILAAFVGFEVITKVPPTLYTPLMSGTNAISGIVLIGALLVAGSYGDTIGAVVGFLAVVLPSHDQCGRGISGDGSDVAHVQKGTNQIMSHAMPMLIRVAYLAATVLFILGLHNLRSPASAIGGNRLAAIGMLIAVVATVFDRAVLSPELILAGLIAGALIGSLAARFVEMTAMPQLVGLFNGFGGAASALVAIGEYARLSGAWARSHFPGRHM
ncbi:MAG: hypothetical protein ETSY2_01955 [Candidatus Entotheonella gemina]|uniref:Uncharacterized protein n=1 Tax=Candidatus Entotheonella gemina TaxID=1429439 RepID=W4MF89_9BACT|nr:MAG: hypothetical protein ETSY2_01955 [Candidatus Entotheonella gemina]